MNRDEMNDIHKIIVKTLKVVPKAWDMHHQKFNCDCHLELTDKTYELVGNRFGKTFEESKKIINQYFMTTGGYV